MNFTLVSQAQVGYVSAAVYELDEAHQEELERRLKIKVKKMRIHRDVVDDGIADLLSPFASTQFKSSIEAYADTASSPWRNPNIDLDVRRSRVTEFMSQVLLEKQYGCMFFESTDKRVNLQFYEADKHVAGIDVTGLQSANNNFRFVVCEVKSTRSAQAGANVNKLADEIDDAYNDKGGTLSREILASIQQIQNETRLGATELQNIVRFLTEALSVSKSKDVFLERIIFFPFLVKQNTDNNALDLSEELKKFAPKNFEGATIEGVIWSFGKTLNEFCNDLYESATT